MRYPGETVNSDVFSASFDSVSMKLTASDLRPRGLLPLYTASVAA